jgi:hypothetical protein
VSPIAQTTLADRVRTWGADSPCFCCGAPLATWLSPVLQAWASLDPLRCSRCGAEVVVAGMAEAPARRAEQPETDMSGRRAA